MAKSQRIPKMKYLFEYLVRDVVNGKVITPEDVIQQLGLRGRFFDVTVVQTASHFTDDTKSMVAMRTGLATAIKCPICSGLLDPAKSVSYDHVTRVRDGGTADVNNAQFAHPYCKTGVKN